jgi:hypothetical protein
LGYEPNELPTAPPRDINRSANMQECFGKNKYLCN